MPSLEIGCNQEDHFPQFDWLKRAIYAEIVLITKLLPYPTDEENRKNVKTHNQKSLVKYKAVKNEQNANMTMEF